MQTKRTFQLSGAELVQREQLAPEAAWQMIHEALLQDAPSAAAYILHLDGSQIDDVIREWAQYMLAPPWVGLLEEQDHRP